MRVNIVKSVAETLDDIFNSVFGGRPFTKIVDIIESIGPANIARKIGLPAPGDLADRLLAEIQVSLKTGVAPKPPKLPSPEELLRR